jgi:hypothetical protein
MQVLGKWMQAAQRTWRARLSLFRRIDFSASESRSESVPASVIRSVALDDLGSTRCAGISSGSSRHSALLLLAIPRAARSLIYFLKTSPPSCGPAAIESESKARSLTRHSRSLKCLRPSGERLLVLSRSSCARSGEKLRLRPGTCLLTSREVWGDCSENPRKRSRSLPSELVLLCAVPAKCCCRSICMANPKVLLCAQRTGEHAPTSLCSRVIRLRYCGKIS